RAMHEQPVKNLFLIKVDRQMQQRRSIDRRPVHTGPAILCATEFRWINIQQTEASLDQSRITTQEIVEPRHVPVMKRHYRCVWQRVTLLGKNLEQCVLPRWKP